MLTFEEIKVNIKDSLTISSGLSMNQYLSFNGRKEKSSSKAQICSISFGSIICIVKTEPVLKSITFFAIDLLIRKF